MSKIFEKTLKKFWEIFYGTLGNIFRKFHLRYEKNFVEILLTFSENNNIWEKKLEMKWNFWKKCYGNIKNISEKLSEILKKTASEFCETYFLEVIVKKLNKISSARLLIKKNFRNFRNRIKFYKKLLENQGKFSKILNK